MKNEELILIIIDIDRPGWYFTGFTQWGSINGCTWSIKKENAIPYYYEETPELVEEALKLVQVVHPKAALINTNDKTLE